ncbi:hypothetical protein HOY80DRAFT_855237, partial [Tuber brumale]
SLSKSTDGDLPSTKQPRPSQPPPTLSLSFWYPRWKPSTHPGETRPTLSLTVDRYFVIAFFVCLFAFLLYVLPYSLPKIFLLHK